MCLYLGHWVTPMFCHSIHSLQSQCYHMCFAINVYPINIDFVLLQTLIGRLIFFTLLLNDMNLLIDLHIKLLLNARMVLGNMLGSFLMCVIFLLFSD